MDRSSRPAAGPGHLAGQLNVGDFVGRRIPSDHEPRPIAMLMVPKLTMKAGRIVTHMEVFVELLDACCSSVRPVDETGVSKIDELSGVPEAKQRMVDQHIQASLMQVGLGALTLLVNRGTAQEPVNSVFLRNFMRAVGGQ